MKMRTKLIALGAAILALGIGTYAFKARSEEAGFGPPFMHHGMGGMMHGGMMSPRMMSGGMRGGAMMGMARDSATMEQLRVIHTLFVNHDRIKRTVTNRPWGEGNYGYGNFNWDPTRFPNPKETIAMLHKHGWRVICWAGPWALGYKKDEFGYEARKEHLHGRQPQHRLHQPQGG